MRLNRRTILFVSLAVAFFGSLIFAYAVLAQPDLGLEYGAATGLGSTDIRLIAARIIRAALGLLGIVALCLILYGGYTWMTAGGNEENIAKAKKILINATIGLIIILSAYAIASFVINALIQATTGGEGGEGEGGGPPGGFTKVLYIVSMPGNDLGCGERNIHPAITFNRPVNIDTINGHILIQKKGGAEQANGAWRYAASNRQNTVVFDPVGDCGVDPPQTDCLDASTTYQIYFSGVSEIMSLADNLSLQCQVGNYKKQCTNDPSVEFITGTGVDTQAPTIQILNPANDEAFPQGEVVEVGVSFTDDFGVRYLTLNINDSYDADNLYVSGCKKTGTTTLNWATGSSPTGTYSLTAIAADGPYHTASDTRSVILRPGTCYNLVLDPGETQIGPPACGLPGSDCGACAGGSCSVNSDCASGWCESGICVDRMQIKEFSPEEGAASTTYLSIYGQYFGEDGGHVYMTKSGGGWTEASVVNCGAGIDNWTPWQIIVRVPPDAGNGPLMVETASTTVGGTERKWIDYTNDDWGPNLGGFTVNNSLILPGLCAIIPSTGTPYMDVFLIGENFGMTQNNPVQDKVMFSASSTAMIKIWGDKSVKARVPALGTGATGVNIYNDNKKSNTVRFYIYDLLDSGAPLIESISPDHGAKGEYITITGKNFGNQQGLVLFKLDGISTAIYGSFDFPEACEGNLWSDKQIIVKFPSEATTNGSYTVQVQRSSDSVIGPIGASFELSSGNPGPGICKLDPMSGPVPFALGNWMMIHGEYFNIGGNTSVPYFWTAGSSPTSTLGRLAASQIFNIQNELIVATPATSTLTGPVVAYRASDSKMGNSLPFTVFDCVKNNNTCALTDMKCCTAGADKGICRLNSELCDGETRSTGYMWRFNTGPFPPTPSVVERCDAGTDQGDNLPSPSPSIAWTAAGNYDHYNVCRTALVNIEFSMRMQAGTINDDNIQVYKCTTSSVSSTFFNTLNDCDHIGDAITMATDSYVRYDSEGSEDSSGSFIQMIPEERRWEDNTWYQVVLTEDILSEPTSYLFGTSTRYLGPQNLKKSRPCGGDSSYCFIFRTDDRNCKLKRVVVTPYSYWTAVLEEPIKYRAIKDNSDDPGSDLYWRGTGLSDQHCIMLDTYYYHWTWGSENTTYADTYPPPTGTNGNMTQVSALANTVAVGLPDDSVNIQATAMKEGGGGGGEETTEPPFDINDVPMAGWWKFDEASGSTIIDSSGNNHGGTIQGPAVFVEGKIGTALYLNGSNNYVPLLNPTTLPGGVSPRSMCAWAKPDNTIGGWRWIMSYGTSNNDKAMFIGMDGAPLFGGAYADDLKFAGFWETATWHHVCLTYDGNTAVLYGDGVKKTAEEKNWDLLLFKAFIGAQIHATPNEFWKGAIDDLRVYNQALTADEVAALYQLPDTAAEEEETTDDTPFGVAYTGESPLTIDLSKPRVLEYWPSCLEACPNAEVGARFNILMSTHNVSNLSVHLLKCLDENCFDTETTGITPYVDPSDRRYLRVNYTSSSLESNTIYQVMLSADGTSTAMQTNQLWAGANLLDASAYGKPMQESFIWRFRTKQEECVINKVEIIPALFTAVYVNDRNVYSAETRAAPDACDPKGQRLDPWKFNWDWQSSTSSVATAHEFITRGQNPACTANCLKKGSDVPFGSAQIIPLCGNELIEAGEDCDPPLASLVYGTTTVSCSLNCLKLGNKNSTSTASAFDSGLCGDGQVGVNEECDPNNLATKDTCGNDCLHSGSSPETGAEEIGASICGNGTVGAGEECDVGSAALRTSPTSSMNCSSNCLHLGSALSASWCGSNTTTFGGFSQQEYITACKKSLSQCGDGFTSPGEDAGCDGGSIISPNCSASCLAINTNLPECEPTSTIIKMIGDTAVVVHVRTEGCGLDGQHIGSSLLYSTSSVCGDEIVGIGEDSECETGFVYSHFFVNPWTLAIGVGRGEVSGEPPAQVTKIVGAGTQTISSKTYTKSGSGDFKIMCGYKTDLECKELFGPTYGVANNTCCYESANLVSTYPAKNDDSPPYDICPNTYLEAIFDKRIDPTTIPGSLIIARGASTTATSCPYGLDDVTHLVNGTEGSSAMSKLPWYKRVFVRLATWFKDLFFGEKAAAAPKTEITATRYCAGQDIGTPFVVSAGDASSTEVNVTSTIIIQLKAPLAFNTDYAILLRPGIRDTRGVAINSSSWKFITGEGICELASVEINPAEYLFQHSNSSTIFASITTAENDQYIQPVDGYRWEYIWAPQENDYVYLTDTTSTVNVVTSKNRNGEMDLSVTTNVTENVYTETNPVLSGMSHITVFLCENPWPPVESFPFKDEKYDFKTYYCRDSGGAGFGDDLPYLTSTVWTASGDPYLKKYLFTNTDNKDAVGVQVFTNTDHLAVKDWFAARGFIGSLGSLKVDGYDAISDGNNTYIDAIKKWRYIDEGFLPSYEFAYTNVYLLSVNSDAKSETKNIFEQLMSNLTFNLDYPNIAACADVSFTGTGYAINTVISDFACQNDLDCLTLTEQYNAEHPDAATPLATYTCLNFKDKMQRNYQRLRDLQYITGAINDYNDTWHTMSSSTDNHYPLMKDNTFLPGQALSVWTNSWTGLGTELGVSLPNDPINKLVQGGTCFKETSSTCYKDSECAIIPLSGRISYWPIEDTVKDEGALANNGQLEGTVGSALGKGHGKALEFTGDSDAKVVIPHKDEYNSSNFTVSIWIYPTKKNTATIIKKGGSDENGDSMGGFVLEYSGFSLNGGIQRFNNGTVRFAIFPSVTNPKKYFAVDSGAPLALNQWHHIVAEVTSSMSLPNVMKLFVDGVQVDDGARPYPAATSEEVWFPSIASNTLNLEAGINFNGLIDNISFYNRGLSNSEINNLFEGLCIMHDPVTGWSAEDRRFSFVCVTSSYAYRYQYSDADKDYVVRANLEKDGVFFPHHIDTFAIINDFVSTTQDVDFDFGVCSAEDEITSPYNIICGDGVLGGEEECDPPGKQLIDISGCPSASPVAVERKTCGSDCTWPPIVWKMSCRAAVGGSCGDGKIQALAGETCDDGALNGQNGRCNTACNGIVTTCGDGIKQSDELCDSAQYKSGKSGWCVGGAYLFSLLATSTTFLGCNSDSDCFTNICYIFDSRYGLNKTDSCNYDCKSRSQYCGDGVVSAEWGELCEADETCSVDGKSGKKKCTFCRHDNRNVSGLVSMWDFDTTNEADGIVYDTKKINDGKCKFTTGVYCPLPSDGVFPGSRSYSFGATTEDMVRVNDPTSTLLSMDFTIEAWVNPGVQSSYSAKRVIQKGVSASGRGGIWMWFTRDSASTGKFSFGVWNKDVTGNLVGAAKIYGQTVSVNQWYHIAFIFDGQTQSGQYITGTFKVYINGEIAGTVSSASISPTNYPFCMGARCVLSGSEYVPDVGAGFKGRIDEVYLYNVALSEASVSQHYEGSGWYCSATTENEEEGVCGNNIVDEEEACDTGTQNGVDCTPVEPQTTCTYCSADCKNVITYEIVCGNGSLDAGENCDPLDPVTKLFRTKTSAGDTCNKCYSSCNFDSFNNNPGSECREAGLGYCGDHIVNAWEVCDAMFALPCDDSAMLQWCKSDCSGYTPCMIEF